MFDLIEGLSSAERRKLVASKRGRDETDYLRMTARNARVREAIIRLGSG